MSASYEGEAPPLTQALALALGLTRARRRLWPHTCRSQPARAARLPPQPRHLSLALARLLYPCLSLTLALALGLSASPSPSPPYTVARSTFYLCKQKSEGFQACELSADFSAHYGENVYVCRV